MEICLCTQMRERPVSFIPTCCLNNGCDANLNLLTCLQNWTQVHGNIEQIFVIRFAEIKWQFLNLCLFAETDAAIGIHVIDIPCTQG